jgi:hypothetical protein
MGPKGILEVPDSPKRKAPKRQLMPTKHSKIVIQNLGYSSTHCSLVMLLW